MRPGRRMGSPKKVQARPVSGGKDKTIKQLLGSLYADREYLEMLLKEEGKWQSETITNSSSKCPIVVANN